MLSPEIFKAYDVRGVVGRDLDDDAVLLLGRAIGSEARCRGHDRIVVGRDGRLSSPLLVPHLIEGLRAAGMGVIDIGRVTTPMAYFAAHHLETACAVMLTGSHNPPEYNGLKIVMGNEALAGASIQALGERVRSAHFTTGCGGYENRDVFAGYLARIVRDVTLARPMRVVLDAGNGVAGAYGPDLFQALGCAVEPLHCQVDGRFPGHHPDPSVPANLAQLCGRVLAGGGEIGLAFDGDGDRLGVVDGTGRIIFPDRLLMLFARDVLSRHPGATVIYDVKSTRNLDAWVEELGGRPLLWKTGHSVIKAKMRDSGALLAGELSGHIFFKDRWYGFDDGLYAGARLLEILSRAEDPQTLFASLPDSLSTPELRIDLAPGEAHALLTAMGHHARFEGATRVRHIDGLRVEYPEGFGLVRASNTTPSLSFRFEADDRNALIRLAEVTTAWLRSQRPDLPWGTLFEAL
ncbi:MAG: phosphomannomutase/phosphoglucomutase [Pseudomonadota bacterium]